MKKILFIGNYKQTILDLLIKISDFDIDYYFADSLSMALKNSDKFKELTHVIVVGDYDIDQVQSLKEEVSAYDAELTVCSDILNEYILMDIIYRGQAKPLEGTNFGPLSHF